MTSPVAKIQDALAMIHGRPRVYARAEVDENDVVTTYDASGNVLAQMHRTVFDALAKHDRGRVVYRGTIGNLRRVER